VRSGAKRRRHRWHRQRRQAPPERAPQAPCRAQRPSAMAGRRVREECRPVPARIGQYRRPGNQPHRNTEAVGGPGQNGGTQVESFSASGAPDPPRRTAPREVTSALPPCPCRAQRPINPSWNPGNSLESNYRIDQPSPAACSILVFSRTWTAGLSTGGVRSPGLCDLAGSADPGGPVSHFGL